MTRRTFSLLVRLAATAAAAGVAALIATGVSVSEGQGPPRPPTDEPGWVRVGDQTQIRFPDGVVVSLPSQEGVPAEERIVWARHEYGPVTNTPIRTGVAPLAWQQRYQEASAWTEWCNGWGWCVEILDTSGVWYYRDTGNGSVFVYTCQAKTHREWNNPYKFPQYSYKKVFSFERSVNGGYAPYGTAADNTWYGIGNCSSTQWWPNSTWVRYGSSWDTMPGWPTETSQYNSIYY